MADINEIEDLRRWIEARPKATRWRDATILVSRAALRVWPLLGRGLARRDERPFAELTLAGVRANALGARRDFHQDYWWRPGETAPSEGVDWGKAVGK
jgi:hypothetical protein